MDFRVSVVEKDGSSQRVESLTFLQLPSGSVQKPLASELVGAPTKIPEHPSAQPAFRGREGRQ
jgi:hypothetical protein